MLVFLFLSVLSFLLPRVGRYILRLQSLFLYQFDPLRDFSLETIFYTLPKLSLIAEDEYLCSEWFIQTSQQLHFTFPISVHNTCVIIQSCRAGIWKLTAFGKNETGETQNDEGSGTIQHKANPYPVVEALDDTEIRGSIKRTQLIVVASLIDKQANLGGEFIWEMIRLIRKICLKVYVELGRFLVWKN